MGNFSNKTFNPVRNAITCYKQATYKDAKRMNRCTTDYEAMAWDVNFLENTDIYLHRCINGWRLNIHSPSSFDSIRVPAINSLDMDRCHVTYYALLEVVSFIAKAGCLGDIGCSVIFEVVYI